MAKVSFDAWPVFFNMYVRGENCCAILLVDYSDLESHLNCNNIATIDDDEFDDDYYDI